MAANTVASLCAQLTVGSNGVYDGACPATVLSTVAMLHLTPPNKPAVVSTGVMSRVVNAGTFIPLSGVGPTDAVTAATLLYMRSADSTTAMQVRLTFGAVQSVIPLLGVLLIELDPSTPLTSLEVQGVGTLEYLATGAT